MLGFDKRAARSTWTAALVLLLLYVVYLARKTLFVFTLALLFAYVLAPLVNLLDRIFPARRTRTAALALAFVIVVAIVGALGYLLGVRVVDEASVLALRFPTMVESWQHPPPSDHSMRAQIAERVRSEVATRSQSLISELPQYGLRLLGVASNLIYVVIIPVLAFFFLKDATTMRGHFLDLLEEGPRRALLDDVISDVNLLLAHYMRALFLLSAAAFATYAIFFSVMRMPYAILLAAVGGLLEFIPMLGPVTAIALILIVASLAGVNLVPIVVFVVLFRVIQDYVVSPHLMGRGVQLHPLLVLFGVFAGAEIAGIQGTFLSGGDAVGLAPFADGRAHVGGESILQAFFGIHQRGLALMARQRRVVHQRGLGIKLLRGDRGLDGLFDLVFQVVALIDHVSDFGAPAGLPFEQRDLVEDAEDLVRIDGSQREIVVGVAAVVEMESAQHVFREQPRHDLLDVLRLIMMPGIHQHLGLRAGVARHQQRHAPIRDVGVIEGRLERLVLDQQALVRLQIAVRFHKALFEPAPAMPDIGRARIAGAIREPQ